MDRVASTAAAIPAATVALAALAAAAPTAAAPGVGLPDGAARSTGPRAASPAPTPADSGSEAAAERTVRAMGTLLSGRARAATRERAARRLERALRAVEREEELLSTWEEGTELARLNAAPADSPVRLSPRLWAVLEEARRWSRATGGAFDPAVGALVDAWRLREGGRRPAAGAREEALRASGLECFGFRPERRAAVRRCPGAWIDAGAFGKGAALERARRALRGDEDGAAAGQAGPALLDFGGQVLALGAPPGEPGWRVGVAHPARRDERAAELLLSGASAATTSGSERFLSPEASGETALSHVIDPRDGRPVPVGGSVTVVHDSPLAADALSTALFVLGPDAGMEWARGREEVGVLYLTEGEDGGLSARWNAAMQPHLADPGPGAGATVPGESARGTADARDPAR